MGLPTEGDVLDFAGADTCGLPECNPGCEARLVVTALNDLSGAIYLVDENGNAFSTSGGTIIIPSSGGGADIDTGNILFVDAVFGGTGSSYDGSMAHPFSILTEALAAASSGDTIFVRPGNYSWTANLLKDGVNWHCDAGVTITKTSNTLAGMFDDSSTGANAAIVCKITGYGKFINTGYPPSSIATGGVFRITNAGSDVTVHAELIQATSQSGGDARSPAAFVSAGRLTVFTDIIDGDTAAIWWETAGEVYLKAQQATAEGDTYGVFTLFNVGAGLNGWFEVQNMRSFQNGSAIVSITGGTPTTRAWFIAREMKGVDAVLFLQEGSSPRGKLYFTAQKMSVSHYTSTPDLAFNAVFCGENLAGTSDIEIWVDVQKITGRVCSMAFQGKLNLVCDEFEDAVAGSDTLVYVQGGTYNIYLNRCIATISKGFYIADSTVRLKGLLNFSAVSGTAPIVVEGSSSLVLEAGTTIIAPGGSNSIDSTTAQNVVSYNAFANVAPHANITLSVGSLVVNSGVI